MAIDCAGSGEEQGWILAKGETCSGIRSTLRQAPSVLAVEMLWVMKNLFLDESVLTDLYMRMG